MITSFPDLQFADENGLLAVGGDLEVPSLKLAYSQGIFPWPHDEGAPLTWYSPDPRGILEYQDLHISQSLKKVLRRQEFTVTFNQNFEEVIKTCAETPRPGQDGTWLTKAMQSAYIDLFYVGFAYSVEVWKDQKLAGGLYGVRFPHFASAESMFYKVSNASKVAIVHLMQKLHQEGLDWVDIQMVTPITKSLGGRNIRRGIFLELLKLVDLYRK